MIYFHKGQTENMPDVLLNRIIKFAMIKSKQFYIVPVDDKTYIMTLYM